MANLSRRTIPIKCPAHAQHLLTSSRGARSTHRSFSFTCSRHCDVSRAGLSDFLLCALNAMQCCWMQVC
jgi:hypothetical protein